MWIIHIAVSDIEEAATPSGRRIETGICSSTPQRDCVLFADVSGKALIQGVISKEMNPSVQSATPVS